MEALEALVSRLSEAESLALSTAGSALSPMTAQIVGLSFSTAEGEAWYVPLTPPGALPDGNLPLETVLSRLKPILENNTTAKYIHNGKYDLILLAENGVNLNHLAFDTMLAAYLLGDKTLGLKEIVFGRTGLEIVPASSLVGSGSKQIPLFQVGVEQVANFACANADMTGRLNTLLEKELRQQGELWDLFEKVEMPLVPVLARMERCGVSLDSGLLKEMSGRLGAQLSEIEQKIYENAGQEFNINSPLQLGVMLFEKLHLPGKKVRGKYSTEASVLEELRGLPYRQGHHGLPAADQAEVDLYRRAALFDQPPDGTGAHQLQPDPHHYRPALLQRPQFAEYSHQGRTGEGNPPGLHCGPRAAFCLAGDYSQIDLRVLAHLSQDQSLLEAFRQDKDIHAATAAQLFGVDIARVTPDMRRLAKTVNFGVIYGMSEFGLEQATELSRKEAGQFITAYFEKYPGVMRYMDKTREQARRLGYVETLLGHRRYVPEVNSANRMVREAAERMAINMPVQGTSSDIIKVAMINLHREMQERGLKSRMLLQVHDELIFEVPQSEIEEMKQLVKEKMSGAISLEVPVKVDIKSGPNWGAME